MQYWFTSDDHFDHVNILKYAKRPFADIHEMNRVLVSNWNEVVAPGDSVYHLGDFSMSNNPRRWHQLIQMLNGNIHLIRGNHDKEKTLRKIQNQEGSPKFVWVKDYFELKIQDQEMKGLPIILMHYGMRVWNKAHYGAFQLYGHSHGTLPEYEYLRSMDVGVDANNYYPISYEEIKKKLLKKPLRQVDHHQVTTPDY